MSNPYDTLGLPAGADDEAIRRRYLELVRQFPPDRAPERFAATRAAYEVLRDRDSRLRHRLFEMPDIATLDDLIKDLACQTPRRRLTLKDLQAAALTPSAIDTVLAEFRNWLESLAELPSATANSMPAAVGFSELVDAFTAMRHEVHLQTKATRSQNEQISKVLESLASQPANSSASREAIRPLLETLADVQDALLIAERELSATIAALRPSNSSLVTSIWWRRIREWAHRRRADDSKAGGPAAADGLNNETHLHRLEAAATGLQMTIRRVERALRLQGLESVPTTDQMFNPETMEAVEAMVVTGRTSGEVLDVLRRGYVVNGQLFRFAQVRVVK